MIPEEKNNDFIIYDEKITHFLLNTRVEILTLIKLEQIEEAYNKILSELPELFQIYTYLPSYFCMHSYLKILKNEGPSAAISFTRAKSGEFSKYRGDSFPVFSKNDQRGHFVDFSYMMGLIASKDKNCDALSVQQFEGFSSYINELILRSFGLYSENRL